MKRWNYTLKMLLGATVAASISVSASLGQAQPGQQSPPGDVSSDEITVAPSRFELVMKPGSEKTMVVNFIYGHSAASLSPFRLLAQLTDWNISDAGRLQFHRPGTLRNSASSWLTYSPVELTAMPGKAHPIRVTVTVPKDAQPGDHMTALILEPRQKNIKLDYNQKAMRVRYRLAVIFYVMVPELTRNGTLTDLKAEADDKGVLITPILKNSGNSHVRPAHSARIFDKNGALVGEVPETTSMPLLREVEMQRPLRVEKSLLPGAYLVKYRVDFNDGDPVVEGQTEIQVKEWAAKKQAVRSGERSKDSARETTPDS